MRRLYGLFVLLASLHAVAAGDVINVLNTDIAIPLYIENDGQVKAVTGESSSTDDGSIKLSFNDSRSRKEAVITFKDAWSGRLFAKTPKPLNLTDYMADGVLSFALKVDDVTKTGFQVEVSCNANCRNSVDIWPRLKAMQNKGWQRVAMPLACFNRDGATFNAVEQPLRFYFYGSGELSVADIALQSVGEATLDCPDLDAITVTPVPLRAFWADDWWMNRHEQKLKEKDSIKPELVMIGDSITHGWEDAGAAVWRSHFGHIPTLNLGFSGDRTENVLWRLEHGELDGINPKLTMIMIGTNNTGHRMDSPAAIRDGVARILDELEARTPGSKVVLLAIFPRGADNSDKERINNQQANQLLKVLAQQRNVTFVNINQQFLDESGVLSKDIMPDLLHPKAIGYEIWAKAITPHIEKVFSGQ